MRYIGYVSDTELDDDALTLDFEETDYQKVDIALVSDERMRIEWNEDDNFCAVTIPAPYRVDYIDGSFECRYPSWEGRRNVVQREDGPLSAVFIANDVELPLLEDERFWIDVAWKLNTNSGRMLFELIQDPD